MLRAAACAALAAAAHGADPVAPDQFAVQFATDVAGGQDVLINITRADAPLGADRFLALVSDGYYDQAAFFRVVPDFVVQFGLAGDPAETKKWNHNIKDDPVKETNAKGTLVYATAGPNTRTTQLFINYADNGNLDSQGFAPFGKVTSGYDTLTKIMNPTPGSSGGIDQGKLTSEGNAYLEKNYKGKVNFITKATAVGVAQDRFHCDQALKKCVVSYGGHSTMEKCKAGCQ